ncbi:MAG: spore coat protein [Bacillota bacterium]|nr:spore coat protein [Bacillota bacterium]
MSAQMRGPRLSAMEKHYIEEQLRHERLCLTKCNTFANQLQDPQLRQVVQNLGQQCQQHVQTLSNLLQQSGFTPPA